MRLKKYRFTKISLISLISLVIIISGSKEFNAETTGQSKKNVMLKTSNLKVDKVIIAQGKEVQESEGSENGTLSRGANSIGYQVVDLAFQQLGSPYVWGATGPGAFDCSGLTTYVYGAFGIYLPRTSSSQFYSGTNITMDELQPGDLVFFDTYESLGHIGIYIGGGEFIHAGTDSVVISSIYEGYYSSRYAGATRVL